MHIKYIKSLIPYKKHIIYILISESYRFQSIYQIYLSNKFNYLRPIAFKLKTKNCIATY